MSAPKLSNLDCTRRAVVKKGCVVQFETGATARVSVVRVGYFRTVHNIAQHACSRVKVVTP